MRGTDDIEHFKRFAQALETKIAGYNEPDPNAYELQKRQMERLMELENELRLALISHRWGPATYRAFIAFIRDERKNILDARPYFRDGKNVFTASISPALKARSEKDLYPYAFNFQFVCFIMKAREGKGLGWGPSITKLVEKIRKQRQEIVEMNLPLAISRARIFCRHRRAHLAYMDLVQISCGALMDAVDKFTPPFKKMFRGVIIGRITGDLIEENTKTMLHFYPVDRRKLYRANKALSRMNGEVVDFEELAIKVNKKIKHRFTSDDVEEVKDVDEAHKTDAMEIADLMSASSCLSLTPPQSADEDGAEKPSVEHWSVAPDDVRPDVQAEETEASGKVSDALAILSVFERKLLRLKGISL